MKFVNVIFTCLVCLILGSTVAYSEEVMENVSEVTSGSQLGSVSLSVVAGDRTFSILASFSESLVYTGEEKVMVDRVIKAFDACTNFAVKAMDQSEKYDFVVIQPVPDRSSVYNLSFYPIDINKVSNKAHLLCGLRKRKK